MKTAIGAAFAALSLAAAVPAAADQAPRTPAATQAAQPGQAGARTLPSAPAQGSLPDRGMMSGEGMSMDIVRMMSSCPCRREAMQAKPRVS